MTADDVRVTVLITGVLAGRFLRVPLIGVATVTAVMFWHGFDTGRTFTTAGGLVEANFAALLLLGFILVMLGTVWALMWREQRLGRAPVVSPRYVLVVLTFAVAGFATGAVASMFFGGIPVERGTLREAAAEQ
jgi:hypothetical protein